ncbi:uncharacterized protein LOC116924754 isoform X2 [Daphnia magna]|uniref:Uncharacterized protein n=1 Tax=Daphnia magna TaxID=35525 RepID=A0ABQ9ZTL3_9CRUS|nr:uncharacterized protein LOC116924754 isoform X2 [Daphnia magna]KAK4016214.1 hypothetical protein OUZ56_031165 [Daphnia magna]
MHFTRFAVFFFTVFSLAILINGKPQSDLQSTIVGDGCIWKGTSPFCDGGCNVKGHVVRETSTKGDGETCLTGIKVLCCPSALPIL